IELDDGDIPQKLGKCRQVLLVVTALDHFHRRNDAQIEPTSRALSNREGDRLSDATFSVDENVGIDQSCRKGRCRHFARSFRTYSALSAISSRSAHCPKNGREANSPAT